jgi:hypothetical protein
MPSCYHGLISKQIVTADQSQVPDLLKLDNLANRSSAITSYEVAKISSHWPYLPTVAASVDNVISVDR